MEQRTLSKIRAILSLNFISSKQRSSEKHLCGWWTHLFLMPLVNKLLLTQRGSSISLCKYLFLIEIDLLILQRDTCCHSQGQTTKKLLHHPYKHDCDNIALSFFCLVSSLVEPNRHQMTQEPYTMLLQQPKAVLKLPLISFLGIQSRLLHKMWLSVCLPEIHTHTHTVIGVFFFPCGRYSHSAWFIHSWIAALGRQAHHVNAEPARSSTLGVFCATRHCPSRSRFVRLLRAEPAALNGIPMKSGVTR